MSLHFLSNLEGSFWSLNHFEGVYNCLSLSCCYARIFTLPFEENIISCTPSYLKNSYHQLSIWITNSSYQLMHYVEYVLINNNSNINCKLNSFPHLASWFTLHQCMNSILQTSSTNFSVDGKVFFSALLMNILFFLVRTYTKWLTIDLFSALSNLGYPRN